MNFKESLGELKTKLDASMAVYIAEKRKGIPKGDLFLMDAINNIESVVMGGGKRLRGALLYHGYKASGGTNEEAAMQAAMGIEFIHAYLLVHDDIMDHDDLRHGVATLHKRYERYAHQYFTNKNDSHFGLSIAIILGDMLCAWGNDCIFGVDLPREQVKQVMKKVQEVVYRTSVGQMRDMYIEFLGEASAEEILSMYEDKTARYTIEAPLIIGLLLGGGDIEKEKIFSRYALPLGIAFQLQDDFLGLYGNQEQVGKRIGADIVEGKFTFLMNKTLSAVVPDDKQELKRILSAGEAVTEDDITWVRVICETSGAKQFVENQIVDSITNAKAALVESGATLPEETKEFLFGLADYMAARTN
jgi:geranylgeranyl diphosphate synthase type I